MGMGDRPPETERAPGHSPPGVPDSSAETNRVGRSELAGNQVPGSLPRFAISRTARSSTFRSRRVGGRGGGLGGHRDGGPEDHRGQQGRRAPRDLLRLAIIVPLSSVVSRSAARRGAHCHGKKPGTSRASATDPAAVMQGDPQITSGPRPRQPSRASRTTPRERSAVPAAGQCSARRRWSRGRPPSSRSPETSRFPMSVGAQGDSTNSNTPSRDGRSSDSANRMRPRR